MIGKILFLSAAAYAGYQYIRRSNRKAQRIAQSAGLAELLPPEETVDSTARLLLPAKPSTAAVEPGRTLKSPVVRSRAAEPDPGR
jgi:hypothetical protein